MLLLHPVAAAAAQDPEELARSGRLSEAQSAFARLEAHEGLDSRQVDRATRISARLNNWKRVVEILLNRRRHAALTESQQIQLYESYLRLGEPRAAEREIAGLVRRKPGSEKLVHLLAFLYLTQGLTRKAARVYGGFIKAHPAAIESRINLALIDFKLGETRAAFQQLRDAFGLDRGKANAYFYRQLARNMPPEGLAQLAEDTKRELGLPQDGILADLYLGREYENLLQYQNAIDHYQRYLAQRPHDRATRLALARMQCQMGNEGPCRELLDQLQTSGDRIAEQARLLSARLAIRNHDPERAQRMLSRLPQEFSQLPVYQYVEARLAMGKGQTARAMTLLKKVILQDPDFLEAYFHLGQLYIRLGEVDKGRQILADFKARKKR